MTNELLIMVVGRPAILGEIIDRLSSTYDPLKVILYGSYARDEATGDSDIDLLIVTDTPNERPVDRFVEVKRLLYDPDNYIAISPLVLTPSELESRIAMGDSFIREILAEGEVLYDSS
jgi:uncharacterized protein